MNRRLATLSLASFAALAACHANSDVGGAPGDGGLSPTPDARADAPVPVDAGGDATGQVNASRPDTGGGACNPLTAWPPMLAAPIDPSLSIASLDLNHDGPFTVSRSYAESVGCPLSIEADSGTPGQLEGSWADGSISVGIVESNSHLAAIKLNAGYTGLMTFSSRTGGAYGQHTYQIGVGTFLRDGAPYTIDWAHTPVPLALFEELYDGIMATFDPAVPARTCVDAGTCLIEADVPTGGPDAGGPTLSFFGVRPLALYMTFPMDDAGIGANAPNSIYRLLPSLIDAGVSDASGGTVTDAGRD